MSGNYLIDQFPYTSVSGKDEAIIVYTSMRSKEPKPSIVLFHDKMHGNTHTDKKLTRMTLLAKDLARSGYHIMNVTYSDFDLEKQPKELENIRTELSYIHDESIKDYPDKYNEQIIVVGYGKGASLALMMAENKNNLFVPSAVIALGPTDPKYPTEFNINTDIFLIDGEPDSVDTATKSRKIYTANMNADKEMYLISPYATTYQNLIDPKGDAWESVKTAIAAQTKSPAPQS